MKKMVLLLTLIYTLGTMLITVTPTYADGFQLPTEYKPTYAINYTVAKTNDYRAVNAIFQILAGGLIYLAAPLAVLLIAIGGLRYVISRGDQTAMDEAKKNITWAIIGLIVIALSWAITVNIIGLINSIQTAS